MAYRLSLTYSLSRMNNVFHVYVLRHYVNDPTHVIDMIFLQVLNEGVLTTDPICILYNRIRQLRRQTVDQVKVQWDNYSPHSTNWEDAYDMHQQFPYLFDRLDI